MTYRPYPDPDRARRQLDRHVHHAPAPSMSPAMRELASVSFAYLDVWRRGFEQGVVRIAAGMAQAQRARTAAPSDSGGST